MKSISTLFILAVSFGCTTPPRPEQSEAWGPASGGLQCQLSSPVSSFVQGQPIWLTCRVRNMSRFPVRISALDFWTGTVKGPEVTKHQSPPGPPPAIDAHFKTIAPGQEISFPWSPQTGDGACHWSLDAPGEYRIVLHYCIKREWIEEYSQEPKSIRLDLRDKWIGELRSNMLKIAITETKKDNKTDARN